MSEVKAVLEAQVKDNRISWEQYFIQILKCTALRSSCLSSKKGAIIVKDNRLVGAGYSGAPTNVKSCIETGVCRKRQLGYSHGTGHEQCIAVHAEANAILNCALNGISTKDCIMYCTHKPCVNCLKMIIQSGIKKVFYLYDYEDSFTDELLSQTQIMCKEVYDETSKDIT